MVEKNVSQLLTVREFESHPVPHNKKGSPKGAFFIMVEKNVRVRTHEFDKLLKNEFVF